MKNQSKRDLEKHWSEQAKKAAKKSAAKPNKQTRQPPDAAKTPSGSREPTKNL